MRPLRSFKPSLRTPALRAPAPNPGKATADHLLAMTRAPDYAGPKVLSVKELRDFVQDTLGHAKRVKQLSTQLGGEAAGHDVNESAPIARVEALARTLRTEAKTDPTIEYGWVEALAVTARSKGENQIDVGKFTPQVAAGLARSGKADPAAIAFHRLAAHHSRTQPANKVELVADLTDALLSPRGYKPALSPQASLKIISDMVERRQVGLDAGDLPLVRRALKLHVKQWGTAAPGRLP
jgi:hypothetical protein